MGWEGCCCKLSFWCQTMILLSMEYSPCPFCIEWHWKGVQLQLCWRISSPQCSLLVNFGLKLPSTIVWWGDGTSNALPWATLAASCLALPNTTVPSENFALGGTGVYCKPCRNSGKINEVHKAPKIHHCALGHILFEGFFYVDYNHTVGSIVSPLGSKIAPNVFQRFRQDKIRLKGL